MSSETVIPPAPSPPGEAQLVIDSEHRLRSENLPWDIDVWYPAVRAATFPTRFLPLTLEEAHAIVSFHDVSWRHAKDALLQTEIAVLRSLEAAIDALVLAFPNQCAFLRLCGRSPKDGEPLDRGAVLQKYQRELETLCPGCERPSGNTKMIAIARTSTLKVTSGKDALSLLLTSERVYSDMLDWVRYGEPEQVCLRQWDDELTLENEFRVFVHNNRITAISQYDHYTYFPSLVAQKVAVQEGIERTWAAVHPLVGSCSYVVDIGYYPSRPEGENCIVIELSPFLPCTGASLFNWTSDIEVLEGRMPMEFRIKPESGIHPQIDDLVEINWDMRWERPFVPYHTWFGALSFWQGVADRMAALLPGRRQRRGEMKEMYSEYLFVYGTLKRGFQWNEKYLSTRVGGEFVCAATTASAVPLVVGDCGVPYVLGSNPQEADPVAHRVVGELWSVTPTCLGCMDDYEGVTKGYYTRRTIEVVAEELNGNKPRLAFIYVLNDSSSTSKLGEQPKLKEYTLGMHRELYRATQHIQIKQKNYYKVASTWGKTKQVFSEDSYQTS